MNDKTGAAAAATNDDDSGNGPDIEAQAREQGWRPQDEYHGKGQWVNAEEFLRRGSAPYLREKLRTVEQDSRARADELQRRLDEVTGVLSEYSEHSAKVEERVYARARAEILREMEAAVEHGDVSEFKTQQEKLDKLEKPAAPKALAKREPAADDDTGGGQQQQPKISAVAKRWIDDKANSWFHTNGRMNAFATAAHGENMRGGMSEADSLEAVSREVREMFPKEFENQNRRAPSSVNSPNGGSHVPPKKTGKTYDDLPKSAKDACDRFVRTIPKYTREKYLAEYDWKASDVEE